MPLATSSPLESGFGAGELVKGAVSQSAKRQKLREEVSAGAGVALARKGGLREDFTDGCGDSVVTKLPPPSR